MPDYTDWPSANDIDAILATAGYSLTPALSARVPALLLAVEREVARHTVRQFKADGADTTRRFDGSGTAELEIDEIVSLTRVAIVGGFGIPGYDLSNVQLVQEAGKPITRLITVRGTLSAYITSAGSDGSPASAASPSLYWVFPSGRQNIEVTGRFGYGATIPEALWDAVAHEVAYRLIRPAVFGGGRVASGDAAGLQLIEEQFGDERRRYKQFDHADLGWHELFVEQCGLFKRPQGRRLRKLRGEML